MDDSLLTQAENIDFGTAVQSLIKKQCIIDFGIVQEVVAKGIVNVSLSVASTEQNIVVITCVLANIASKAFTLNIEPEVGDRVIIFYPRNYDDSMFTADGNTDIIINNNAKHYSLLGGIAFLFNQYKTNDHKNFININKDGIDVDCNGKAELKIDKNGNISVDAKQGKYTIKNSSTDLKTVIDGLAQELENLVTTGSPAIQATSPASKATIATWRNTKLNQLMD